MRRPLLSPATGLCFLLCGALLALWLRSYRHVDFVLWKTSHSQYSIGSAYGRIALKRFAGLSAGKPGVKTARAEASSWDTYFNAPLNRNHAGFAWVRTESIITRDGHEVFIRLGTVPDWFLLLLLLGIIVWLTRRRPLKTP